VTYHDAMEWLGRVDRRLVDTLLSVLEDRRTRTWRARAACRTTPTAAFFPRRCSGIARQAAARAICADCPVRAECLDASRGHGHTHGIWAGQGERQHRPHRRPGTAVA
jgi:WhiB family transcriptional regulator, redox-sensing transcriptional regulator